MLHLTYTLEDFYLSRQGSSVRHRDLCMKENIDWIIKHEGPKAKVLIWAHNLHVMYDSLPWKDDGEYFKVMGLCLKDSYQQEVYTIGFDFNKGRFLANKPVGLGEKELTVYDIASAPSGTLANTLSKVSSNMFFIDIATVSEHKVIRDKWQGTVLMRNFGGMVPEVCVIEQRCSFVPLPLLKIYDGLIFVNETLEVTRLK